jgi:hypothetical protein
MGLVHRLLRGNAAIAPRAGTGFALGGRTDVRIDAFIDARIGS